MIDKEARLTCSIPCIKVNFAQKGQCQNLGTSKHLLSYFALDNRSHLFFFFSNKFHSTKCVFTPFPNFHTHQQ